MLAIVTLAALVLALGMGVLTWRVVQEDRRRSAARIAALVAELDRGDRGGPLPAAGPRETSASAEAPLEAAVAAPGWPDRAGVLAAGFGVVLVIGLVGAAIGLGRSAGGEEARSEETQAQGAAAEAGPAPVELLALDHEPLDGVLAIRGVVRAASAAAAGPLAVQATALDAAGAAVGSGRVDLPDLQPGAVLPFVIDVPARNVSRFRIRFLRDAATVPHVDRRAAAAADRAPSGAFAGGAG